MKATIKSTKWYGRFWPPERRKIKLMQAIMDYKAPEIEKEFNKAWSDHIIYGKPLPKFAQPIQDKTNDGGRNGDSN